MSHSVHVCACGSACVRLMRNHSFHDFRCLINHILLIYSSVFNNLCHAGLFAYVFYEYAMWRHAERLIGRFKSRSSLK